jgi:hypothetical protein
MNEPPYFREWVRQITISVFAIGGQPLSVADMHTTVNIVTFFALALNKILYVLFNVIQAIAYTHSWVKKIIVRHFMEIIIVGCLCMLAAQTDDITAMNYTFNFVNILPSLCWILMSAVGKFMIAWTGYYLWHLVMAGASYFTFQVFMSFMRHIPMQTETL